MIESIPAVFSALSTGVKTAKVFKELIQGKRGNTRALLEEISAKKQKTSLKTSMIGSNN